MKKILYLCLFAGIFFSCNGLNSGSKKTEALFDKYYEKFPEASMRNATAADLESEREAFMFYTSGHLDKAAAAFQGIYEKHKNPRHHFYAAVSNLGNGKVELATMQLETIKNNGGLSTKYMLDYYLGLAYLRSGKTDQAKAALQNVGSNFQYYKKKADALLLEI